MSVEEVLSKARARLNTAVAAPSRSEASFTEGAMQSTAEGLLGNLMGIPEVTAKGVMNAGQLARYRMGYEDSPYREGGLLAPSGIDFPTGRESAAGIDTALGNVGLGGLLDVSKSYDENLARRNQVQEQAPFGTFAGDVLADASTIATGRIPLLKGRPGGLFDESIKKGMDKLSSLLGKKAGDKTTGAAKFSQQIVDADLIRDISKGIGRAGETGLEGMALSVLQDGNPQDAFALSAGAQMGASLVNTGIDEMFEFIPEATGGTIKPPKTFKGKVGAVAAYAGLMGGIMSLVQNMTPLENDQFMADESGYDKAVGLLFLGATLGLTGRRSKVDGAFSAFPQFADFAASVPRTAVTSFISDVSKDETGLSEKAFKALQSAPDAFSESQLDQLLQGFETGNFSARVQDLSADQKFMDILNAPDPRLAGVPVNDD